MHQGHGTLRVFTINKILTLLSALLVTLARTMPVFAKSPDETTKRRLNVAVLRTCIRRLVVIVLQQSSPVRI